MGVREYLRAVGVFFQTLGAEEETIDPSESGWWTVEPRAPKASECGVACSHCRTAIGADELVKACPECGVLLHATCYDDTEGGRAFATEGCDSCRHRTYWR
jgi:hypothetical protein